MSSNLLASMSLAGVLERSANARILRVSPRFLAHAEGTAGRLQLSGHAHPAGALEQALKTWDDYHGDCAEGGRFLHRLLADRGQLGALAYPSIDQWVAA